MKNLVVSKILYEIADMLEMQDVEFKPQAYRKAARSIEIMSEPVEDYAAKGKLKEIPGVGESIAERVEEIVKTGKLKYYEKLKKSMPMDFESLMAVEGMGPKRVKLLYQKLKIKTLEDLEKAVKVHKLQAIPGFGTKIEEKILQSIEMAMISKKRNLLGIILPVAESMKAELLKYPAIKRVGIAGSLRRMKETIGDIDILAISTKPSKAMEAFTTLDNVESILAKGPTKSMVWLKEGTQADMRVVEEKSFGSALNYFTGSKDHNIALRRIAIGKGWKLSEYGLFKGNKQIAGRTEEDLYQKLGMRYIEPELREMTGEIEAAQRNKLPKLIDYNDIRGDLQVHSTWSDGRNSIEEMARAAKAKGYEYLCISDHVGRMKIAGSLSEKRLMQQLKEVAKVNERVKGMTLLTGAEIDIRKDGSLDISPGTLKQLDIVVASIHSSFQQTREDATKRLITAMENEYVDTIGHPTGRKILEKQPIELDLEKVFEASKRTGTYLEINSQPNRLDLSDVNVKAAVDAGCKLVISTDAHSAEELKFMRYGIATARRGWVKKVDIINALPLEKLHKILKK